MSDGVHPSHELVVGWRTRARQKKVPCCVGFALQSVQSQGVYSSTVHQHEIPIPDAQTLLRDHPMGRNMSSVLSAGRLSKSGAFLPVFSLSYCRMREEHSWLIVPRGLRIRRFTRSGRAEMGRCKPSLKVFPGGPASKANMEHARCWGSCLGGRCPPALWADPSPCREGDAVGPDHGGAGGEQTGRTWAAWEAFLWHSRCSHYN